jgi:hypothetical protein
MTITGALQRLENRTAQLVRLTILEAPEIILAGQQRLVAQAREWADSPPPEIPD